MTHFGDKNWNSQTGKLHSGSTGVITYSFSSTSSVARAMVSNAANIQVSDPLPTAEKMQRHYRVYYALTTTTTGTRGSGADQTVIVQVGFSESPVDGVSAELWQTTPMSICTANNKIRGFIDIWGPPQGSGNTTIFIYSKQGAGSLGNGTAGKWQLDWYVEAV